MAAHTPTIDDAAANTLSGTTPSHSGSEASSAARAAAMTARRTDHSLWAFFASPVNFIAHSPDGSSAYRGLLASLMSRSGTFRLHAGVLVWLPVRVSCQYFSNCRRGNPCSTRHAFSEPCRVLI